MFRLFLILILTVPIFAQSLKQWRENRESLDKFIISEPFRVFYTLEGKNALVDKSDINQNNIPDYVENLLIHIHTANYIFKNIIGFDDPLQSKRYKNRAFYIDINIIDIENEKYRGQTIDKVFTYKRPSGAKSVGVLTMEVERNLEIHSTTPIHELLHVYMNSYTILKNKWLIEGLARQTQRAFGYKELNYRGTLGGIPKNKLEAQKLFTKSYDAFPFWNELLYRLYGATSIDSFPELQNAKYVDGNYAIDSFSLHGYKFLKPLFEELQTVDEIISKHRDLKLYNWSYNEQNSHENDRYIWTAILKTILKEKKDVVLSNPDIKNLFSIF